MNNAGLKKAIVVLLTASIYHAIRAIPFILLWNWLVVYLFHMPAIGFWRAFGLLWLAHFFWPNSRLIELLKEL
jgi:hypothetical protein